MRLIYGLSPLLFFILGYFYWRPKGQLMRLGNGLFMVIFIGLLALLLTSILYVRRKKKVEKSVQQEVIDATESKTTYSFYTLFSSINFYTGLAVYIAIYTAREIIRG